VKTLNDCLLCACLLLACLSMAVPVEAQIGSGAFVGNVVDQAGAAVPGATITVRAASTGLTRVVVTDQF
jgi:hypothetical protein